MTTTLSSDELRPYKAVLVAHVKEGEKVEAVQVLRRFKRLLGLKATDRSRKVVAEGKAQDPEAAFVRYEDRRQVPWAKITLLDKVNHLAVVMVEGNWLAIHMTENARRATVSKALREGKLGPLTMVRPGHLKAAFVKGRARTLWLRGTHRSTSHKADTKVLGGPDLAPALDPIGDQSYRYTAARCEPGNEKIGDVMGLAVDHSRLWVGPSMDWSDFETSIRATLEALDGTVGADVEPLPVLAAAKTDLIGVDGAYDVAVVPPEMLMVGPVLDSAQAAVLAEMEQLAFATHFDVISSNATALKAAVSQDGVVIGEVDLEFRDLGGEIGTDVSGTVADLAYSGAFNEVLTHIRDPDVLTVYFDSGHTVQSRQAFTVRHRDLPFEGWDWVSFGAQWEVDREKPRAGIAAMGNGDRSLFSWVLEEWPASVGLSGNQGWLACDDRPGETADFLHIDESGAIPTLTLIHVKGANGAGARRGIAVVPYETVCSQAVKNLRHLDNVLAGGELLSGTVPVSLEFLAWNGGRPSSRRDFIARLDGLGTNFRRRVTIVQPHVRKDLVDAIRGATPSHSQLPRLRQLDTLLHGTAANCRSAGAELVVVGDG